MKILLVQRKVFQTRPPPKKKNLLFVPNNHSRCGILQNLVELLKTIAKKFSKMLIFKYMLLSVFKNFLA